MKFVMEQESRIDAQIVQVKPPPLKQCFNWAYLPLQFREAKHLILLICVPSETADDNT